MGAPGSTRGGGLMTNEKGGSTGPAGLKVTLNHLSRASPCTVCPPRLSRAAMRYSRVPWARSAGILAS